MPPCQLDQKTYLELMAWPGPPVFAKHWPPAAVSSSPSVMSFAQQLATKTAAAMEEFRRSEEVETQRLLQTWVAETKEKFMADCEEAALQRKCCCRMLLDHPDHLIRRDVGESLLLEQLQAMLSELGFHKGIVTLETMWQKKGGRWQNIRCLQLTARWTVDDAASSGSDTPPKAAGGSCATCPICHDQRPPVVLVPCGHVVCRDCQRDHRMKKCPMCREVTTSATRGLFMS